MYDPIWKCLQTLGIQLSIDLKEFVKKTIPEHSINLYLAYRSDIMLGNSEQQVSDIELK